MATATEIAEMATGELERQLGETRRELFNLRFQLATGQLDNFSRIRHVRKDVARMMTELRIREIAEAEGMAFEDLPIHRAAARRRSEEEALGRSRTTAAERRAAARAAEAGDGDEDEDEAEDEAGNTVQDRTHDVGELVDADGIEAEPDTEEPGTEEPGTEEPDTEEPDTEEKV